MEQTTVTHDPHAVPHIQLSGISKAYPNGVQALQNIDLTLYEGEIFGIIGRSGAGKSTLLRLFNRLENADSGEITIHGEQLQNIDLTALCRARFWHSSAAAAPGNRRCCACLIAW
ncbi:hypothetical protein UA70_24125, partial [Raoultella planticola]